MPPSDSSSPRQELEQKDDHSQDENEVDQSATDMHQKTNQPKSYQNCAN
jgi:hypothetical protein